MIHLILDYLFKAKLCSKNLQKILLAKKFEI